MQVGTNCSHYSLIQYNKVQSYYKCSLLRPGARRHLGEQEMQGHQRGRFKARCRKVLVGREESGPRGSRPQQNLEPGVLGSGPSSVSGTLW